MQDSETPSDPKCWMLNIIVSISDNVLGMLNISDYAHTEKKMKINYSSPCIENKNVISSLGMLIDPQKVTCAFSLHFG